MRITVRLRAALAAGALAVGLGPTHAEDDPAARLPVERFYRNPDVGDAALSPSGRHLAVTVGIKGKRVGLAVIDLQQRSQSKIVAHYSDTDVARFTWVSDDRLVLDLLDSTGGGAEQSASGRVSIRPDGSDSRRIDGYTLLHVPVGNKPYVIVGRVRFGNYGQVLDVFPERMYVETGGTRSLAEGTPPNTRAWLFDPQGEPRLALCNDAGESVMYWKGPGRSDWKEIARHPLLDAPFEPAFVDGSGAFYVTTVEGPARTRVLRRFDFDTGRPAPETIASAAGFDVEPSPVFDESGRLLGIRVVTDGEATYWFDARLAAIQKTVDALVPGHANRVSCQRCSSDEPVVLVHSWSDQDPGRFALYNVARKELEPVANVRADIDPKRMATLDLHRFKARDGMEIPVWVTLPPGADKASPPPAVVLVHGGPWIKGGSWQWHEDAQFLASRGYVVIEPEFRGSTGYGDALFRAGWKQWGQAMQHDVADATKWAANQGWIDPKKVCIAGASYGGYATLMGMAENPELYRCGVAWVAVTDPRMLYDYAWSQYISRDAKTYTMPMMLGDPDKDAAMLARVAPVELASRITAPVLLAFGGADPLVVPRHGYRMRSALRDAGNSPEWLFYEDEGHGWLKEANRFDFARRMESFLAKHLK